MKVYSGIYEPDKEQLKKIRNKIAKHPEEFKKLRTSKPFVKRYKEILGEKSKRLDAKYASVTKIEPLIFNKAFYFITERDADYVLSKNPEKWILDCYKDAKAMNDFLKT